MKASGLSMIVSKNQGNLSSMRNKERAARIVALRNSRGLGQDELAALLNVSRGAVGNWELGGGVKAENLEKLATEFGVTVDWIVKGVGQGLVTIETQPIEDMRQRMSTNMTNPVVSGNEYGKMPVYASAEAGRGALIMHPDPIDFVMRPENLTHVRDAYAIEVTGDSMKPAFKHGDRATVNPLVMPAFEDDCILYTNNHGEERIMIKQFLRATETEWIVQQHNPPLEIRLPKSEWRVAKVAGKLAR